MPDVELRDLVFALLGLGLSLTLPCCAQFFHFGTGTFIPCHCMLDVYNLFLIL